MIGGGGIDGGSWNWILHWRWYNVLRAAEGGFLRAWSGISKPRPVSLFDWWLPSAFCHVLNIRLLLVIQHLSGGDMQFFVLASLAPAFSFHVDAWAHVGSHEFYPAIRAFFLEGLLPSLAVGHLEFCNLVVVLDLFVAWFLLLGARACLYHCCC